MPRTALALCLFSLAVALGAAGWFAWRTPPAAAGPPVSIRRTSEPTPAALSPTPGTSGGQTGTAPASDTVRTTAPRTPEPVTRPPAATAAEAIVRDWRTAILTRNRNGIEGNLRSLRALGDEESTPRLLELSRRDPDDRVRAFATRALGQMRDPAHTAHFLERLEEDRSPFVRENAAWSLGELGAVGARSTLERIARDDPEARVRNAAQDALGRIGG